MYSPASSIATGVASGSDVLQDGNPLFFEKIGDRGRLRVVFQEGLDSMVKRGNELLERFEKANSRK